MDDDTSTAGGVRFARNTDKGLRIHDLRHTHATILVSSGLNIKATCSDWNRNGMRLPSPESLRKCENHAKRPEAMGHSETRRVVWNPPVEDALAFKQHSLRATCGPSGMTHFLSYGLHVSRISR